MQATGKDGRSLALAARLEEVTRIRRLSAKKFGAS